MILSGLFFGRTLPADAFGAFRFCFRSAAAGRAKLLLWAVLCCVATPIHAAISTISVNATLPAQAADFTDQPISFSQFDPSLGTLKSVRVIVKSDIQLTQQYENTSDKHQVIQSRQTFDLVLELPDETKRILKDHEAVARTYSASAFDGVIDFDGTSGSTTDYEITSVNQKLLKSRAKLAMFTGSGLANLFLSGSETFQASNKQNQLVADTQACAGADIQIIYSYIAAVPEPAVYGLATGLAASFPFICHLISRRRVERGGIRK